MEALSVKCPQCGAVLQVTAESDSVTCEYCAAKSIIQRRTGLLERRVPLPALPPGAPPVRIAVQKSSGRARIVAAVVVLLIAAGIGSAAWFAVRAERSNEETRRWRCTSEPLLLVDANADGVPDPICNTYQIKEGGREALIAVDGATGRRLWTSFAVPGGTTGKLAVAGARILYADDRGTLTALSANDGRPAWESPLGEKARAFCLASPEVLVVTTADEVRRALRLADGTPVEPVAAPEACAPVSSDALRFDDSAVVLLGATPVRSFRPSDAGVGDPAGMSISEVLERSADGARLALGNKSPGSAAPMIALLGPDGTARWTLVVPTDPLGAMPGSLEIVNLAWVGERAFVAYERMNGGTRASFAVGVDLVSGRRLWETEVADDGPFNSLVAASGHLFVSTWSMVVSLDPESGKILWQGADFE